MCARRVSRVKPPFGGLRVSSFRECQIELKKAQLALLELRIRSLPAPSDVMSAAHQRVLRAQRDMVTWQVQLDNAIGFAVAEASDGSVEILDAVSSGRVIIPARARSALIAILCSLDQKASPLETFSQCPSS